MFFLVLQQTAHQGELRICQQARREIAAVCWLCQRGRTLKESRAKKALNKPGSNNSTVSDITGHFRGYHFFKNKPSCIFIMRITIIHCISDFSFRYVMYNVIKCITNSFTVFCVFCVLCHVFRSLWRVSPRFGKFNTAPSTQQPTGSAVNKQWVKLHF